VELPEEENTPEKRVDRIFSMKDRKFIHCNQEFHSSLAPGIILQQPKQSEV